MEDDQTTPTLPQPHFSPVIRRGTAYQTVSEPVPSRTDAIDEVNLIKYYHYHGSHRIGAQTDCSSKREVKQTSIPTTTSTRWPSFRDRSNVQRLSISLDIYMTLMKTSQFMGLSVDAKLNMIAEHVLLEKPQEKPRSGRRNQFFKRPVKQAVKEKGQNELNVSLLYLG